MKHTAISSLIILSWLILFYPTGAAQVLDVAGVWTKTTHPDPNNITIFYSENDVIKAIGYGLIGENFTLWYAEGAFREGEIVLRYHYSAEAIPPGWEPDGTMRLKLSPDGGKLVGHATSDSGNWVGVIGFRRVYIMVPDDGQIF